MHPYSYVTDKLTSTHTQGKYGHVMHVHGQDRAAVKSLFLKNGS